MSGFLPISLKAYRAILFLYPRDLRRDFGDEMTEAFEYDLTSQFSARSVTGVVRVWWLTLLEVIRIGLRAQLQNPVVAAPAIAAVVNIAADGWILMAALKRQPASGMHVGGSVLAEIAFFVILPGLLTASAAFLAVHRSKSTAIVWLRLV